MIRRTLVIVGTRSEAIKMAPVYRALAASGRLAPILVSTGQHTDLLKTALAAFDIVPDHELAVMFLSQPLGTLAETWAEQPDYGPRPANNPHGVMAAAKAIVNHLANEARG